MIKLHYEQLLATNLPDLLMKCSSECEKCEKETNLTTLQIKYILCVDVEDSNQQSINLEQLNTSLHIGEQVLILIGVIGFEEPIGDNTLRHYIAYNRNFNGVWSKYDNVQTSKRALKLLQNEFDVMVALAIYAEYALSNK